MKIRIDWSNGRYNWWNVPDDSDHPEAKEVSPELVKLWILHEQMNQAIQTTLRVLDNDK